MTGYYTCLKVLPFPFSKSVFLLLKSPLSCKLTSWCVCVCSEKCEGAGLDTSFLLTPPLNNKNQKKKKKQERWKLRLFADSHRKRKWGEGWKLFEQTGSVYLDEGHIFMLFQWAITWRLQLWMGTEILLWLDDSIVFNQTCMGFFCVQSAVSVSFREVRTCFNSSKSIVKSLSNATVCFLIVVHLSYCYTVYFRLIHTINKSMSNQSKVLLYAPCTLSFYIYY